MSSTRRKPPPQKAPQGTAGRKQARAPPRATQAERRGRTRARVLESAAAQFGEHGYEGANLEAIAAHAGVTIRPIYHYFGNKRALFEAVVIAREAVLARMLDDQVLPLTRAAVGERLRACFELFTDRHYRQIVLIDGPGVLGTERWAANPVVLAARARLGVFALGGDPDRNEMIERMAIGALTAAALSLAEPNELEARRRRIEATVGLITSVLPLP